MEIAAVVGVAILVFGADKLPKLAKSAGQAKKEFLIGQAEADIAAEKAREEARAAAAARATEAATPVASAAEPPAGAATTTTAPPHAG
jgi:sec-independent protein translocase protein TatA